MQSIRSLLNIRGRFTWFATELYVIFLALKDPRAPRGARLLALIGILYIISPVDIFPDIVPVAGIVDDVAVIPVVLATLKLLIPRPVLDAARRHATDSKTVSRVWWVIVIFAALLVVIWVVAVVGLILFTFGVI